MFKQRPAQRSTSGSGLRRSTAVLGAFAITVTSLVGLGLAAPSASASVTAVTGSAYGLGATGLVPVSPTPEAVYPGGPASADALSVTVPLVAKTGALHAATTPSGVPGASGSVTSTATVADVALLASALQSATVTTSCTSGAGGSQASTTIQGLEVAGAPLVLPDPLPANFGIDVPGLANVVLNRQTTSDRSGSTSIEVEGLYAQVLGGIGSLTTIKIATSSCGATGPDVEAAPTVTGLSPDHGPTSGGTAVMITGTDFTGATAVDFGDAAATDVVVSPNEITAVSPPGTGTVDVTVTNGFGTSPADPGDDGFTYIPAPTVMSVLPSTGPAAGGRTVTLDGTDLAGATAVDFGTTPATGVSCTDTTCTVTTPAGAAGTTVPVTVTTPDGTSTSTPSSQYTYGVAPAVTGLSPVSGPTAGGTLVSVDGANLASASAVDFGTSPASIVSCSATLCKVVAPAGPAGQVDVTVTTPAGTSPVSAADRYTYVGVPAVTGISPVAGPGGGGTVVTVTGTDLCDATAVDFGGTAVTTFTANTACTQLMVTSPAGTGTVDVTVTTPGGTSPTTSGDEFSYAPVPTVTSLSPSSGPTAGGTPVAVSGSGLSGATGIDFGSTPATSFSCSSDTSCTATSPAGTGDVPVTVTTAGGTSDGAPVSDFTYTSTPTVSSLDPDSGPAGGGTDVTITGTGLAGTTAVDFASTPATSFSCSSDTTCEATSPAGTPGATVAVTVTTPDGTSSAVDGGQFTYGSAPAIDSISPDSGAAAGGTPVTITGANLADVTSVLFGTAAATITTCSDTVCQVVAPAGTAGDTVTVTATSASGTSAPVDAGRYTYVAGPAVATVSPSSGPATGGSTVTVTGSDLCDASAVDFGSAPAPDVTVAADCDSLVATAPPGTGTVDVTVTTPGGTSPTGSGDTFGYAPVPAVTSISPVVGPAAGGTTVTITGTGFTGATTVDFGGAAATGVRCASDTTCTAVSPAGTGEVPVTVTTPGGTSIGSQSSSFTYIAAPGVTSLAPNTGPPAGGTAVTITGTDLSGTTAVDFGTAAATIVGCSDTACEVTSPAGTADATVPVTVETPDGTSATGPASEFTYGTLPAVDGVSPGSGPVAGGNTVTVTGANLEGATAVDFGSTPATGVDCTATACTVVAPAGTGAVDVTVTTPSGTSPTTGGDTYTYLPVPSVGSISPTAGPVAGGTTVVLTGTGLATATGIDFGTAPAGTFHCSSETSCTAVSPAGSPGTVPVTVVTPGGRSPGGAATDFTWVSPFPYHAVSPYRIADTRSGSGLPGAGSKLGAGSTLVVAVAGTGQGSDAVPTDATVAVLNVTEANATAPSLFTVYPTGDTRPDTSNVSFVPHLNSPDLVEVALGKDGEVSIYNRAGQADAVVDVEGYVGPATPSSSTAGRYNPLDPARLADTRKGSGEPDAGRTLGSGYQDQASSLLNVQVTGRSGVPASGVSAVVLNVTATDTTAPSFFTVYPQGTARPNASNLNFNAGMTVPNRVIVPVGPTGKVSVYNHAGSADLVMDVSGWFSSSTASSGDIYSGMVPVRIADTRAGSGLPEAGRTLGSYHTHQASSTLTMAVAGHGGVPAMGSATPPTSVVLSVTVVDTTADSYITVYPGGEARPVASDINWHTGVSRANLVVVKLGQDGDISLTNWAGKTDVQVDVVGFYTADRST